MPHRPQSLRPALVPGLALVGFVLVACASSPETVDLADHPDPVARHFDGCAAFLAPDDGLLMECPERGLSMLVRSMPVPARAVREEMSSSWPELSDAEPLAGLDATIDQVVMHFTGESDTPGERTEGLMAVADVGEVTRLALCGQSPSDGGAAGEFDAAYCRESLTLLVERGQDLPDALFPAAGGTAFVGRELELDSLGCSSTEPDRVDCADGSSLQWLVASSERTAEMLAASPDAVMNHLLGRGGWKLDRQSPPCLIEEAPGECRAVRVAQGQDVVIVLFGRGLVRDEHVFLECSYVRENAYPELDKNIPAVCAQVMTLE